MMQKNQWLLYVLAFIKFILPFFLQNSFYQPHRDEFLYLAEAHHLAWGFMEVPPLLSVFAWLTNLFGNSMFWIKFWPSLFGAFTYIITGKIILSLGGRAFALFLAFLPFIFGAYLRVHYLFQPNFLEIFFWTLIAYCIIQYIQTEKIKWLYFFGVSVGWGMMSKYSVTFFVVSILIGLLLTAKRKIFTNKHFYYSALIAFIIFLPNLIWQYNHRFPVLHHMKELQETQLQYISTTGFLIDQLLMNLPCVFIWLAGLYFTIFSRYGKKYSLFVWAYVSVIVLLIVLHGKNYYTLGVYPVLFAFGAVHLESFTALRSKAWRYAFVMIPFILGIPFIPIALPVAKPEPLANYYKTMDIEKTGLLKWEDLHNHPLPQDFADMLGWKGTAEKAAAVYKSLPANEQSKTLVYCRNYGFAGALNLYGKHFGLPEVYSDNGSFLLWMPDKYEVQNLILIGHDIPDSADLVFQQFEKMTIKDSLNEPLSRENGVKIILYENGNNKVNGMIENGIAEMKKEFTR